MKSTSISTTIAVLRMICLALLGLLIYISISSAYVCVYAPRKHDGVIDLFYRIFKENWLVGILLSFAFVSSDIYSLKLYNLNNDIIRRLFITCSITLISYVISQVVILSLYEPDYLGRQNGEEAIYTRFISVVVPLLVVINIAVYSILQHQNKGANKDN